MSKKYNMFTKIISEVPKGRREMMGIKNGKEVQFTL